MATRDNGATKFETVRYEPKGAICHIVLNRPEKLNAATDQLVRSEEHTSELQSQSNLVCRLLLETISVLFGWHITVENVVVPVWTSLIWLAIAGYLAYHDFTVSRRVRSEVSVFGK